MAWIGLIPESLTGDITSVIAGAGLTGGGIDSDVTLNVIGGSGITANANDIAITAAQTTITSVLNTSLVIGRDADNDIDFATDNQIIFRVGGGDNVIFKASGEIEATKFDGALEGNADTATVATTVTITDNESTDETNAVIFTAGGAKTGGNLGLESDGDLTYNPSSGTLAATAFTGNLTGDSSGSAGTVTSIGNLTGDVTSSNRATTIAASAVHHSMLNNDIISGQGAMTAVDQADLLMVDDGPGTVKKITFSNFEDEIFGNVSGDGSIAAGGALTVTQSAGDFTVTGDLTVSGDTITANVGTLDVEDKNITLNKSAGDSSSTADGAGITIQDAVDASNDASILWTASSDTFTFSHAINANVTGNVTGNVSGTAATVTTAAQSNITSLGTLTTLSVDNITVNGNEIISSNTNGNIDLDANGSGNVVFKGNGTRGAGQFILNCEVNTHGITIKGPPHSAGADYTLTLPNNDGDADQVLKTDGSGNLAWVAQSTPGGAGDMTQFYLEDDDGTEVTIDNNKEVKFIGAGITTNWTDVSTGNDGDPYDLTFTVDAAQTGITSVLNASLTVGRDAHNQIDFSTDNEIHFKTNNETPVIKMKASGEIEATKFDGALEGNADTATLAANATHVTVTDNESTNEENLIPFIEDASATGNVGLESDGDFAYNPSTGTVTSTIFKGNIDAVDGDFDGTLEADAITVGGTALNTVIAGVTVTNATTAAVATTVTITDNESTNENNPIVFVAGGDLDGGNLGLESDGDLHYNPSTGLLSVTAVTANGFNGDLTGEADTVATIAGLAPNTATTQATQPNITSLGSASATTNILAGDLTMYNAVNNGNPTISLGSSATNRFEIKTDYNSGAQTVDQVYFSTYTTSSTANDGRYIFEVDEVELGRILDDGLSMIGFGLFSDYIQQKNTTASSATEGGKIILMADDGAAMADGHRLGVVEFSGAEDASNNRQTGAKIQAMCDATWSASENGTRLEFYTMDGNAASELSLTLDSDKVATFTGDIVANRQLNVTSATHFEAKGDIVYLGSGSTTQGELCYLKADGAWAATDADAVATSGGVLLALALGTDPDADGMLLRGMFTLDHDPGTIADELYVSTTAGDITGTAPSGSGDIVRVVGYCLDSTNGQIWFNPSNDFIVLA